MFKVVNSVAMHVDKHSFVKTFVVVHFCQLDTNQVIPGKRGSQLMNSLDQADLQAHLWSILINY